MLSLQRFCLLTCAMAMLQAVILTDVRADTENIEFTDCYITVGPKVVKVHAGYCRITNQRKTAVAIVGAASKAYGKIELHQSTIEDGIASMRQLRNMTLAPGQSIVLKPEGMHLMLMQPKVDVTPGDRVQIAFELKNGAIITVEFQAKAIVPKHHGSHHGQIIN